MIDMVALQSLIALAAHGTVGAAAASLGYTPSAVSQQIKRLESQSGVPLLERIGRGVVLTEAGRLLVAEGREVLARMESLESSLRAEAAGLGGTLRLAAFSTGVRGIVAPLAGDLARTAPDLALVVTEKDPAEAVELVATGQVDVALVHSWTGVALPLPAHLCAEHVGHDVADLLVHREHRLAAREQVTPGDLLEELWASTAPGTICHEWFTHMFSAHRRPPQVRFWSWEFASQVRLVEEGVAVALVPRLGRGPLPAGVVPVPVVDPIPRREVRLLWRETMEASPAVRHLRARLAAVVARSQSLDQSLRLATDQAIPSRMSASETIQE
ncbi:LysR family transcriptional regulator [Nocardioides houyundeii]|uniref:LysR family transcriptional regulator n=1 Tax=Nocardioides houyundeii TaxID=2045452 RepID=UPI000C763BBE|nr:LysR family transcriptional regulator [Nocardioides houyundeii]